MPIQGNSRPTFRPLVVNALYTGIERGLAADVLSSHALGGKSHAVCTAHIAASHGIVTDVLEVPTDAVAAQLEHLFDALPDSEQPNGAKISIVNHAATVNVVFDTLRARLAGPIILDLTLGGPSGEDIIDEASLEALKSQFTDATIVTLRAADASLVASMEIHSLDDAQVAAQRIHKLGARRVLLRCGALARPTNETNGAEGSFESDLLYDPNADDGDEFSLFEAPQLAARDGRHAARGASSLFTIAVLSALHRNEAAPNAVRWAKALITESLRMKDGREISYTDIPSQ